MDQWQEIAEVSISQPYQAATNCKFHSYGDWSANIYLRGKTEMYSKEAAIQDILKQFELDEEEDLEREVKINVDTFSKALEDCWLKIVEEGEKVEEGEGKQQNEKQQKEKLIEMQGKIDSNKITSTSLKFEDFYKIGSITSYESLVSDGNTKISLLEDNDKFYCIFLQTS